MYKNDSQRITGILPYNPPNSAPNMNRSSTKPDLLGGEIDHTISQDGAPFR